MKYTNNLNLSLYEPDDQFNITGETNSLNHNMEIIDETLGVKNCVYVENKYNDKGFSDDAIENAVKECLGNNKDFPKQLIFPPGLYKLSADCKALHFENVNNLKIVIQKGAVLQSQETITKKYKTTTDENSNEILDRDANGFLKPEKEEDPHLVCIQLKYCNNIEICGGGTISGLFTNWFHEAALPKDQVKEATEERFWRHLVTDALVDTQAIGVKSCSNIKIHDLTIKQLYGRGICVGGTLVNTKTDKEFIDNYPLGYMANYTKSISDRLNELAPPSKEEKDKGEKNSLNFELYINPGPGHNYLKDLSEHILVQNINIEEIGAEAIMATGCNNVIYDNVSIRNIGNKLSYGFDLEGGVYFGPNGPAKANDETFIPTIPSCTNITIQNCYIKNNIETKAMTYAISCGKAVDNVLIKNTKAEDAPFHDDGRRPVASSETNLSKEELEQIGADPDVFTIDGNPTCHIRINDTEDKVKIRLTTQLDYWYVDVDHPQNIIYENCTGPTIQPKNDTKIKNSYFSTILFAQPHIQSVSTLSGDNNGFFKADKSGTKMDEAYIDYRQKATWEEEKDGDYWVLKLSDYKFKDTTKDTTTENTLIGKKLGHISIFNKDKTVDVFRNDIIDYETCYLYYKNQNDYYFEISGLTATNNLCIRDYFDGSVEGKNYTIYEWCKELCKKEDTNQGITFEEIVSENEYITDKTVHKIRFYYVYNQEEEKGKILIKILFKNSSNEEIWFNLGETEDSNLTGGIFDGYYDGEMKRNSFVKLYKYETNATIFPENRNPFAFLNQNDITNNSKPDMSALFFKWYTGLNTTSCFQTAWTQKHPHFIGCDFLNVPRKALMGLGSNAPQAQGTFVDCKFLINSSAGLFTTSGRQLSALTFNDCYFELIYPSILPGATYTDTYFNNCKFISKFSGQSSSRGIFEPSYGNLSISNCFFDLRNTSHYTNENVFLLPNSRSHCDSIILENNTILTATRPEPVGPGKNEVGTINSYLIKFVKYISVDKDNNETAAAPYTGALTIINNYCPQIKKIYTAVSQKFDKDGKFLSENELLEESIQGAVKPFYPIIAQNTFNVQNSDANFPETNLNN